MPSGGRRPSRHGAHGPGHAFSFGTNENHDPAGASSSAAASAKDRKSKPRKTREASSKDGSSDDTGAPAPMSNPYAVLQDEVDEEGEEVDHIDKDRPRAMFDMDL